MVENIYLGIILFTVFTVVSAGNYCSYNSYGYTSYMYCSSGCCGDRSNRYCCDSNTGMIVGIVLGVIGLVAIVVTVLVVIFCCCRKTKGRTGQVCQPAGAPVTGVTVPVYGMQTTTVTAGYGQMGYQNAAFPQQMPTSNIPVDNTQKWQEPPPPYSAGNPM